MDFIIEFIVAYIVIDAIVKIGKDLYAIGQLIACFFTRKPYMTAERFYNEQAAAWKKEAAASK